MKKLNFLLLLLASVALIGCGGGLASGGVEPDEPGSNSDSKLEPINTPLSPNDQKNLLVEVGEELIGTFNPNDQKKAVELADDLYYKYKNYDWSAIGEEFEELFDDIYSSEFESFFGMPKRVINAINGKQNASLEDLEILLTLSKFGYTIEFDDAKKSVKITKTGDAAVVAKFSDSNGTKCELKVYGEGKTIKASYTYEDYYWKYYYDEYGNWIGEERIDNGQRTIKVEVPTTIKMHLKQGSSSLISFTFKWDSNLKDYVNTSLDMKVINLGFKEETKVSTTEASAVFSFTYSDKDVITAAVSLPQYKLIGWDGGNDITEDEGINWLEEYGEKYASLLGKVGKGEAKLDILGRIQLKGGVTDGADLVDAYYNWNNKYNSYNWGDYERTYTYTTNYKYWDWWYDEYGYYHEGYQTYSYESTDWYWAWWEGPYYSLEAKQAQCDFLNKYTYLSVYYNNGTAEQAKLVLDPYAENGTYDPASWQRYENEWYSGGDYEYYYTDLPDPIPYSCYNIEPVLSFPEDGSQIAVLTYFNSTKFLSLLDLVEDLVNSYIALDKHNLIFPEGFEVEF